MRLFNFLGMIFLSNSQVDELYTEYDEDGSGSIDITEFRYVVKGYLSEPVECTTYLIEISTRPEGFSCGVSESKHCLVCVSCVCVCVFVSVCECVCVCQRERTRERGGEREREL